MARDARRTVDPIESESQRPVGILSTLDVAAALARSRA
jgi:hypothetical protein